MIWTSIRTGGYNAGIANHMKTTRREVVMTGAALTAASYSRVLGANDRLRLGVIGCGSRGTHVSGLFTAKPDVQVTALCDVYRARMDKLLAEHAQAAMFPDHRELLDKGSVDAVLITVPDHWHVAIGVDALNAGKDVYVEKPLTLRIDEGPAIIKAARVNNRICQVGMQRRSSAAWHAVKQQVVDSGKLGKVTLVKTWWHGNPVLLWRAPEELRSQPASLDWNRFLGPVRWRPYDAQQYYSWRSYLDFGGGMMTDLFTHLLDASHFLLGVEAPVGAVASGGVYQYRDGRTSPDTITAALEYNDRMTITFEGTLLPSAAGVGVVFYGTGGRLEMIGKPTFIPLNGTPQAIEWQRPELPQGVTDSDTFLHVRNFVECVRSRKQPNGDVRIGHRSAAACHLATQAYIHKKRIAFDPEREEIL
jgi:predicted dehydrogenase